MRTTSRMHRGRHWRKTKNRKGLRFRINRLVRLAEYIKTFYVPVR